jgi:hypothetical protein
MAALFGLIGAVVATPLLACVEVVIGYYAKPARVV